MKEQYTLFWTLVVVGSLVMIGVIKSLVITYKEKKRIKSFLKQCNSLVEYRKYLISLNKFSRKIFLKECRSLKISEYFLCGNFESFLNLKEKKDSEIQYWKSRCDEAKETSEIWLKTAKYWESQFNTLENQLYLSEHGNKKPKNTLRQAKNNDSKKLQKTVEKGSKGSNKQIRSKKGNRKRG